MPKSYSIQVLIDVKQRTHPSIERTSSHETYQQNEMTSNNISRPRSCSKGEELWQIHLQRSAAANKYGSEDDDDDHDYPEPRHPKRSIGEELFEIHLKRSKGTDPDYDVDDQKVDKEAKGDGRR